MHQVILIQPEAPAKPALGAPCNGCGLCCLAEPCPLGMVLSLSRRGPCKALRWDAPARQYRCGALVSAQGPAPSVWARLRVRVLRRWIAAGVGCDCELAPALSSTMGTTLSDASDDNHD